MSKLYFCTNLMCMFLKQWCVCLCPGIADKTESSSMLNRIGAFLKGILVKYWIVCCCSMFFVISFSGKVVVYKILYICLFLICVVLYQVRLPLPFKHSHIRELSTGHPSLETCRLSWSKCIRYILI